MKIILNILIILMTITCIKAQTIYTVTNTNDPDPFLYFENPDDPSITGSLQWAIRNANEQTTACIINFDIPGNEEHVILLYSDLPIITNQVMIDGYSQQDYQYGNPQIIIDGQEIVGGGLYFYNSNNSIIKGICVRNFLYNNLAAQNCNNITILDNLINQAKRANSISSATGLRLISSVNNIIKGNFIGTDFSGANKGNADYGIFIDYGCSMSEIGGTGFNEGNTIAYNGLRGLWIGYGSGHKISGNKIFNNPVGILLQAGVNNDKQAPIILSYSENGTVTGSSEPGDIIEIFGSNGNENANEYLTSVTADGSGNWTANVASNSWNYAVATATDGSGNSSTLSLAKEKDLQGLNCENSINIIPQNTSSEYQIIEITNTDLWFNFTSNESKCLFIMSPTNYENDIVKVELYRNNCYNLELIKERIFTDLNNVSISFDNLILNDNYYIKIIRNINVSKNYFFLLKNIQTAWLPSDCYSSCNTVYNGDFEVVDDPTTGTTAFIEDRVCQWTTIQYPNNFLPELKNSDFYSGNNHVFLSKRHVEFCDFAPEIYTPLFNFQENKQYKIEFYYKIYITNDDGTLNNTSDVRDIRVHFKEDIDYYSANYTGSFTIFEYDNVNDWKYYSSIITSSVGNYNYLRFSINGCQFTPPSTIMNVHIDKISLTPINDITISLSNNNICEGEAVNVQTSFSGIMPQIYNWTATPNTTIINSNTATITANPAQQTTFSVTVTDDMDCSANASITVEMKPVPTPDFTFDPSKCQWVGGEITFTNTTPQLNELTFLWDFGDGTTSSEANPVHTYYNAGYYCIKLTAINDCGFENIITLDRYIFPNACACDDNIQYDYKNEGQIVTSLNNGETVGVTLIVESVCTVPDNASIYFGPKGRIIVKPGATLKIGSKAILTSLLETCDYMWQGIEVWGNSNESSTSANQGVVMLSTYAEINNAHIGILSGARNLDYICSNTGDKFILANSGGVIKNNGTNVKFNNNGVGIRYIQKQSPYDASANVIKNITFKADNIIDPLYTTNQFEYYYPTPTNPFTAYANTVQRTGVGLWIDKQRELKISNCVFNYMQHGIYSFDTKYNVTTSKFRYLYNGISNSNTFSDVNNKHEISRCEFDYIPGVTGVTSSAIYLKGGKYDKIFENTFGHYTLNQSDNYQGIYMFNSSAFNITENTFYKFQTGINIYYSGSMGGFVGANADEWRGNKFTTCAKSIYTKNDNSKLVLRCNSSDNDPYQFSGTNWYTYNKLGNQGYMPSPTASSINKLRSAAGNEFRPEADPLMRVIRSHNISYNYYRHDSPDYVIPVSDANATNGYATINIFPVGVAKTNNIESCPPRLVIDVSTGTQQLSERAMQVIDNENTTISNLRMEYNNVHANLDNGKTVELLSDIQNRMAEGKLKSKLITNSPLSDTVITSIITQSNMSAGNFKNIMQQNLPVSQYVEPVFYNKLQTLPQGIANQLKALQANNPGITTPALIEREIATLETDLQLFINDVIIALTDSVHNSSDVAIQLLESDTSTSALKTLAATYLGNNDLLLASQKLSEINISDSETADWYQLTSILLELYTENNNLSDLDSLQIEYIRTLAYKCPAGLASANAQAILELLFNEYVPECPVDLANKSSKIQNDFSTTSTISIDAYLGDNYPEPANNKTTIDYFLPDSYNGRLVLSDIFGRIISEINLEQGENTVEIKTSDLSSGIYIYTMKINNEIFSSKKLTIIR